MQEEIAPSILFFCNRQKGEAVFGNYVKFFAKKITLCDKKEKEADFFADFL